LDFDYEDGSIGVGWHLLSFFNVKKEHSIKNTLLIGAEGECPPESKRLERKPTAQLFY
jgi:hypothetical protein